MTSLLLIWNATHLFSQNIIQKWPKSSGEVGTKNFFFSSSSSARLR